MKQVLRKVLIPFVILSFSFMACKKECINIDDIIPQPQVQMKPKYSTQTEFYHGITEVITLIQQHNVIAFKDTLPNGYPNVNGQKEPLVNYAYSILEKLQNNQVQSAVYDVFHFDGKTFSLISYIQKANYAGQISAQTVANIIAKIPLPPIPVAGFEPPLVAVALGGADSVNCCDNCNPEIKIRVSWGYRPPCGNYDNRVTGYAANNKLTNMSGGQTFRFDAEVFGCSCPGGVMTSTVTAPNGASYGANTSGSKVTLYPQGSGTYTITFTFTNCGKTVTKSFTLNVR